MGKLLAGKTAVVTGAASGIGRGIACTFADHGADVVVADVRETPRTREATPTVEYVADETDARGTFVECDVTDGGDVEAAVDAAAEFGGIDVMVNNAGISLSGEFLESTEDDYDAVTGVNLKGVYFGCRAAGERMVAQGGGSIINIASTAADSGYDAGGGAFYAASKGGVKSMTYAVAATLGPEVRVNAIQPGYMVETGLADDAGTPEYERERAAETALEELGTPEDVANVAVFLASDLAGYVTAESIVVDGGWLHTGGP